MDKAEEQTNKKNLEVKDKLKKIKSKPKVKKPKKNTEKQIIVAPRIRLEPRLSLPSSEKNKSDEETFANIEKDKRLVASLNPNEIDEYFQQSNSKAISHLEASSSRNSNRQNKESIAKKSAEAESVDSEYSDDEEYHNFCKKSKHYTTQKVYWTDREIRDLAYALQHHGSADVEKLAAEVKTKTKEEIKCFIKATIQEIRKTKTPQNVESERHRGRPKNSWTTASHEILETWPIIRKWRRLAYEQMLSSTRAQDYSGHVILELCNQFYEEEPEPSDPQVINVKLIYKFIADCMAGAVPPQLPPKESALVLDMLREVRLMPIAYDFEEERQFLKDYKRATTFKPFHVKDEFKKKIKKGPEMTGDPNAVAVPQEVFMELSRHKRLVQCFNPLMIPAWLLQKEQEHLEKYFEESAVYVD